MNKKIIRILEIAYKQWYLKIILIIIVAYLTIWLCNNLPCLIKQITKQFNSFLS